MPEPHSHSRPPLARTAQLDRLSIGLLRTGFVVVSSGVSSGRLLPAYLGLVGAAVLFVLSSVVRTMKAPLVRKLRTDAARKVQARVEGNQSGPLQQSRSGGRLTDRILDMILGDPSRRTDTSDYFCLYLRPLATDRTLHMLDVGAIPGLSQRRIDVEELLADSLAGIGSPLVAVECDAVDGRPTGEFVGAGGIRLPENAWPELVKRYMEAAHVVFMVPGLSPGIAWEIATIASSTELLLKTIWIMPPSRPWETVDRTWKDLSAQCATHGIHLPPYKSVGALVLLGRDECAIERVSLKAGLSIGAFLRWIVSPTRFLRRDVERKVVRMLRITECPQCREKRCTGTTGGTGVAPDTSDAARSS